MFIFLTLFLSSGDLAGFWRLQKQKHNIICFSFLLGLLHFKNTLCFSLHGTWALYKPTGAPYGPPRLHLPSLQGLPAKPPQGTSCCKLRSCKPSPAKTPPRHAFLSLPSASWGPCWLVSAWWCIGSAPPPGVLHRPPGPSKPWCLVAGRLRWLVWVWSLGDFGFTGFSGFNVSFEEFYSGFIVVLQWFHSGLMVVL